MGKLQVDVIVGVQYADEGKGKVTFSASPHVI